MTSTCYFTVPGKPMTWARAGRGNGVTFTPPERRSRMSEIRNAWSELGVEPFERGCFLRLSCVFLFERTKSHFGTGRNEGVLKDRYLFARPLAGQNGGDLDNLVKLVKDSLNKIAFHDDAQIVEYGQVLKDFCRYEEMAQTRVRLDRVHQRPTVILPDSPYVGVLEGE